MGGRDLDTLDREVDAGAPEADAAEDLRSTLSEAFDEAEAADVEAVEDDGMDEAGQPRDERGRWTRAQREHFERQQQEAQRDAQEGQQEARQPEGQEELRLAPPGGWSPAAKAAYASLPREVQEAVARREVEINNGFRKLQEFKGLEEYADMARSSGTTLKEAFDRYRAAEDLLDRDFLGGISSLCEMYNVHPMQLAQAIAARSRGQPQQASDPQASLLARELAGIREEVRTLKSERERAEQEGINSYLQAFAQENIYFEDVRRDMGYLISTGQANSLEDAYDKACWMNPQIRDLLLKGQAASQSAEARVSKARRASGSLPTGAPAGSPSGGSQSNSIREALEEAWGQGI